MNAHKVLTAEEGVAIYAGTIPDAAKLGDPFRRAELRKEDAIRSLPRITKLISDLMALQGFVLDRSMTGRLYSDEDHIRLSICETFASLEGIDEGMPLHELIRNLRFDLGKVDG